MVVTGSPASVSGIVTKPFEPVYPVIVIVPLLVVKVNWACTEAGSVKSSKTKRAGKNPFTPIH
jgi:hypothetical protein